MHSPISISLELTVDTPRVNFTLPPSHVACTDLLPMGSCVSSMKLY